MKKKIRVLGIDPGYATVGYGVVDCENHKLIAVNYGAIVTASTIPFHERLEEIYSDVCDIIKTYSPDCMAVERLFFTNNQKTGIDVAQARGVILLAAAQNGVCVSEHTPLQVKQAVTGYGKATKNQVQEMIKRILNLPAIPKPDDTSDALAIAICQAHICGSVRNTRKEVYGLFGYR